MITIRAEHSRDFPGVRHVNELAFGQPLEANRVEKLRAGCPEALSLVAETGGQVVGHTVPDEAFMALGLDATAMAGVSGVVTYRPEFSEG